MAILLKDVVVNATTPQEAEFTFFRKETFFMTINIDGSQAGANAILRIELYSEYGEKVDSVPYSVLNVDTEFVGKSDFSQTFVDVLFAPKGRIKVVYEGDGQATIKYLAIRKYGV